jgi:hypothetical protein
LLERLAFALQQVVDAGLRADFDPVGAPAEDQEWLYAGGAVGLSMRPVQLRAAHSAHCEVPPEALVTAEQAESALGHNLADDFDDDPDRAADKDQRAEQEVLRGVALNPDGIDYSCLAVNPLDLPRDRLEALGCPAADSTELSGYAAKLTAEALMSEAASASSKLQSSVASAREECQASEQEHQRLVLGADLDPTQRLAFDAIKQWALQVAGSSAAGSTCTPPLRLLLLGTAGTGKTHTLRSAVRAARAAFGSFDSVLMVAHTGVAAANMGPALRFAHCNYHPARVVGERGVITVAVA